jgi:hypothetical protein
MMHLMESFGGRCFHFEWQPLYRNYVLHQPLLVFSWKSDCTCHCTYYCLIFLSMTMKSYQQKLTEVVDMHSMEAWDVGVADMAWGLDNHMDDDDSYGVAVDHRNTPLVLLPLVLHVPVGDTNEDEEAYSRIHNADEHGEHTEGVTLEVVVDTGFRDVDTLDTLCYRNDAGPFDLRIALHWTFEALTSSVDHLDLPLTLWSVMMIPPRVNPLVSKKSTMGTVKTTLSSELF